MPKKKEKQVLPCSSDMVMSMLLLHGMACYSAHYSDISITANMTKNINFSSQLYEDKRDNFLLNLPKLICS